MTGPVGRDLFAAAVILVMASLVLLSLVQVYPIREFYVSGNTVMSNDQVGYLTSARWLAETGELRSHLIYPAYADQPRWRLYMPGIYYVLAAGHVAFGSGSIAWRIPAMMSFVLATVGVFLIGRRFYGRMEGAFAALLFALFPPMGAYALTAMAEIPLTAAVVAAFCVFAFLPPRLRSYFLPFLLVVPFLFRETAALLIIPMILVLIGQSERPSRSVLAATVVISFAILFGVLEWQKALGKASIPLHTVRSFNYSNSLLSRSDPATIQDQFAERGANVLANLDALRWHFASFDGVALSLIFTLALALLAVTRGVVRDSRGNRDWLSLGAGVLALMTAGAITVFHTWTAYRGLRTLLFTFPLLVVSVAPTVVVFLRRFREDPAVPRRAWLVSATGLFALLLGGAWWGTRLILPDFSGPDGRKALEFMEAVDPDHSGVLVAPDDIALDYVLRHYPLRFSFVPANARTLRLLCERHRVQTLLVGTKTRQARSPRYQRTIRELGLVQRGEMPHPLHANEHLLLFERPRSAERGSRSDG